MVKVARRTPLDPRHHRLVRTTVQSDEAPARAERQPVQVNERATRLIESAPLRAACAHTAILLKLLHQYAGAGGCSSRRNSTLAPSQARRWRAVPAWTYARGLACVGSSALVAPCTSVVVFPVGALVG